MIRFASTLILAALVPAAAAAQAPPPPSGDWRVVVTDHETDVGRILGFADAGTRQRSGNAVSFWLEYRIERATEEADGFRGYVTADCTAYTYSSRELTKLAGEKRIGPAGEETGLTAKPGTNIRAAIEKACAGFFPATKVDPVAYAKAQFGK